MILRWLASRRDFSGITVARTAYYRAFYALQHTAVSLSGGQGRGSPPLEAKRGGIKVRTMNRIGHVDRARSWGQTQASRQTAMSGYVRVLQSRISGHWERPPLDSRFSDSAVQIKLQSPHLGPSAEQQRHAPHGRSYEHAKVEKAPPFVALPEIVGIAI